MKIHLSILTLFLVGVQAFAQVTSADNSAYGQSAGASIGLALRNAYFGSNAGQYATSNDNTFIGYKTGAASTNSGFANTFIGSQVGLTNTSGNSNVFLGSQAGKNNTIGSSNTFLGVNAGKNNTTGQFNLFVGGDAGQANTSASENLFFGNGSGFSNTTGQSNTFVGLNSGYSNIDGGNNVFIGQRAGYSNTTGGFNMFMGASTGQANTSGVYNTFVGNGAGYSNVIGNNNTFIGLNSGFNTITSNNVTVGYNAGLNNTTGTRNTFIGTEAGVSSGNPSLQNATAIGYGAQVSASNAMVLGGTGPNSISVGIGVTNPKYMLTVNGIVGAREVNVTTESWSDFVFENTYQLPSLKYVKAFIGQHKHLPEIPSAHEVITQGINLGQMDTKLLQKIEELTLYLLQQQEEINESRRLISPTKKAKKEALQ